MKRTEPNKLSRILRLVLSTARFVFLYTDLTSPHHQPRVRIFEDEKINGSSAVTDDDEIVSGKTCRRERIRRK